jgi:predicted RNA-binding Zn ribbon-like protein
MSELELLGGRLALDFANTLDPRNGGEAVDYLPDYQALLDFGQHADFLDEAAVRELHRTAASQPAAARAVWQHAIGLREAIYRAGSALVDGRRVQPADLALIWHEHGRTLAGRHLWQSSEPSASGHVPGPTISIGWLAPPALPVPARLELPVWHVAVSAVETLTTDDATRIGICPDEEQGCGWLFYDETRNRSRRWCSMANCGAEAKARRLTKRRSADRAARRAGRSEAPGGVGGSSPREIQ